jgi:tetratricopeptide (TPR) repeat protein
MKKTTVIIALCGLMAACSPSQEAELAKIAEFEKSEKTGTKEGLEELALLHKTYGMKYTDAQANDYLYAAGQYYFYENNLGEAQILLTEYISRDDSTDRFRNAAINLALVHTKATEFGKADDLISEVLDDNLPTAAQWQDVIKIYEQKIEADKDVKPMDYERLTLAHTAVGSFDEAIGSLAQAASQFPEYENRGNLLYRAGFVAWEYAKDIELAKKYYNQFLAEYPNHQLAPEVKEILSSGMLEMSDEDILNMLKGKAKK